MFLPGSRWVGSDHDVPAPKEAEMASTDNSRSAPDRTSVDAWFGSDDTAACSARAMVQESAEGMEGSACADAVLVVSELVANAVEHGIGDEVRVRLTRTGMGELQVSVFNRLRDHTADLPERPWRMPGVDATRGRGLAVVESLSSQVRVTYPDAGVEVTATVVA